MNKDLTELVVVLDESGSMDVIVNDTIGGFNVFLNTHQKLLGQAKLTLVKFNTQTGIPYNGIDVKEVKPLNNRTYMPGGGTALLDAVGKSIDLVLKRINASKDEDIPAKIIFCILTDGEENSSKEYTLEQVKSSIENMRVNNGWEFIFIGANQDAWAAGGSMGVNQNVNFNYKTATKTFAGMSHFSANSRAAQELYEPIYASRGVNVVQMDFADSFSMDQDALDVELTKLTSVTVTPTEVKPKTKRTLKKK